jgi:RNA polymerase sigma-70 factor (ECF subfamily)
MSKAVRDDLFRRSRQGDGDAYADLVGPIQPGLYNLAVRSLGDREEARDVVQDALVRAWLALPSLRNASVFKPWIFRITANLCANRARARRRKPVSPLDDNIVQLGDPGPEGAALARHDRDVLRAAVLELTVDLRLAIVLRDVNGLSYDEIAAVLDVPVGTVRSRISRARAEMRALLGGADRVPAGAEGG